LAQAHFYNNINKINFHGFFTGMWFFLPVMFIYFKNQGLSYVEIGLIFTVQSVAKLFLEVPSGAFADHFGRKWSMAIANLSFILCFLAFGLGASFWWFLVGGFFKGLGQSFQSGSDAALIYDSLVAENNQQAFTRYYGKRWGYFQVGFAVSALGAVPLVAWDIRWAFLASGIANAIAVVLILLVKEPPLHRQQEVKNPFEFLQSAFKFIISHSVVRWLLGFHVLIFFGDHDVFPVFAVLPP